MVIITIIAKYIDSLIFSCQYDKKLDIYIKYQYIHWILV